MVILEEYDSVHVGVIFYFVPDLLCKCFALIIGRSIEGGPVWMF